MGFGVVKPHVYGHSHNYRSHCAHAYYREKQFTNYYKYMISPMLTFSTNIKLTKIYYSPCVGRNIGQFYSHFLGQTIYRRTEIDKFKKKIFFKKKRRVKMFLYLPSSYRQD